MKITSKYLIVPVNRFVANKTVLLYDEDGKLVFDFDAHLDTVSTKELMYYNVERFRGMELTVAVVPEMDITFEQTDICPVEGVYDDPFRPAVHFSAARGWLNDPNGLVYHDGTYHLFFQHNPLGTGWGNMHWGHATSHDLLHWTEQDTALFPHEMGAPFSGSGIVDERNVSGLSPDGKTLLFYHTAAANRTRLSKETNDTQCLAYSTDGGKTFRLYENNPVLPWQTGYNRDPKVIWCEELGVYLLTLYMDATKKMDENEYRFYESDDLLHWKYLQTLDLPDDNECPNIFLCDVENEPGEKRWVFAGAHDIYVVGHFDKTTRSFVIDSTSKKYFHHMGTQSYAAQTFSGTPDRCVRMAWLSPYCADSPFNGFMGIPTELSLVKLNGEYYLRGLPVRELEGSVCREETYRGNTTALLARKSACDITVTAPRDSEDFTISLYGLTCEVKCRENKFVCGEKFIPLSVTGGDVKLRIIADTLTWEIFLDDGLVYTVVQNTFDRNRNRLNVTSDAAEVTVKELENIHK